MLLTANSSHSSVSTNSISPWDTQRRYSDLGDACPARVKPTPGAAPPAPPSRAAGGAAPRQTAVPSAPTPTPPRFAHHRYGTPPSHHPEQQPQRRDSPSPLASALPHYPYPSRSYSNLDADVVDAAQYNHRHNPADAPWLFDPPANNAPAAPPPYFFADEDEEEVDIDDRYHHADGDDEKMFRRAAQPAAQSILTNNFRPPTSQEMLPEAVFTSIPESQHTTLTEHDYNDHNDYDYDYDYEHERDNDQEHHNPFRYDNLHTPTYSPPSLRQPRDPPPGPVIPPTASVAADIAASADAASAAYPTRKKRPAYVSHAHSSSSSSSSPCSSSSPSASTATTATGSSRPKGYPRPLGHGNGFPVLARGRFTHPHSTIYHIHASPNKRFRVHDIADRDNQPLFRLIPTPLCLRETKTLVDLRQPRVRAPAVLRAHTIVFTTRASVVVNDARGRPVLFLQKTCVVQSKRIIRGYVGGDRKSAPSADDGSANAGHHGAKKPHLVVREEERGKSYAFNDARANEIAHLQRYRLPAKHASAKRKYAYKLNVSGGYDCALFIMAAVLMLDIWDD